MKLAVQRKVSLDTEDMDSQTPDGELLRGESKQFHNAL